MDMTNEITNPIECDHEWERKGDSFYHEYGLEMIIYLECRLCGVMTEYTDYEDMP